MDWDLRSYFSEFGGATYTAYRAELEETIGTLDQKAAGLIQASRSSVNAWETFIIEYEHMQAKYSHISSYLSCLTAAEATNDAYVREEASFAEVSAAVAKLTDKIIRGIGALDETVFADLLARDRLEGTKCLLREFRKQAEQRMSGDQEALAADLAVNGIGAWSRLYFTAMGNLSFRYMDPETGETEAPMAQLNSLLSSPYRERRLAAKAGSANTFEEHKHTYAAAINAISGTRLSLNKHRGVKEFLEPSLRQSRMSYSTLAALISAIEYHLPFAREVFQYRMTAMGIKNPGYADLKAPLPVGDASGLSWADGVDLVSKSFNGAYPRLGKFFDEMIHKKWIDHTPREGKRPGGFCTGSLATRESRIFMTYKDTLNDVLTLAHEAGHAWHSRILKDERVLATRYPMTLAETASTFAERILTEGVLSDDSQDPNIKLILLDTEIEHMLAFLLDLPVRFRFEQAVYEHRQSGNLSPSELCELMRETQQLVFGDTLAPGGEDPWFWASKLHFYIENVQFYNYPYTFGYLLSTGYMSRFREGTDGALNTFERFLANSGKGMCEDIVRETLGEDIMDPNFWARLIESLRDPFDRYKEMLESCTR